MKSSYEQVVRVICGDDWSGSHKSQDERDGGFGVAIILAYLNGVPARINDLSRAIDVPPFLLEMSFKRLQLNGMFIRSWVMNDPLLLMNNNNSQNSYESIYAWCHIAGMSSGYTGKGLTRDEYRQMRILQQEYEDVRLGNSARN